MFKKTIKDYIMIYTLAILFFLGIVQPKPAAEFSKNITVTTSWYEKGKQLLENDNWQEALGIWEEGKRQLSLKDQKDPRIGIAYIRLVTSKKLKARYSNAITIYFWGLKAPANKTFTPFFRDEIQRLRPIAGNKQADQWLQMLNKKNPELGKRIINFWNNLDTVLSTDINERLIEHWLRIDYSKKHFTKNDNNVFGTDDRGSIYVKYGKPSHIYSRRLSFNASRAFNTANTLLSQESSGYVFVENSAARYLAKEAKDLHGEPEITIWKYDKLPNPEWDSTVFLFGKKREGPFKLLTSLEELFNGSVYKKLRYRGKRYQTPPVFLAQQQLYESVQDIAPIFRDRFSDIQQEIFLPNKKITLLDALDTRDQSFMAFNHAYLNISKQISLFENTLPSLPTRIQQYRMLDTDSNKPYVITSVFCYPLKPAVADFLGDYSKDRSYVLSTIYQPKAMQSDSNRQQKKILYDLNTIDEDIPIVTIFKSPNTEPYNRIQISSELSRPDKPTDFRGLETNIKAVQQKEITTPTPLNSQTEKLEMSDIILGYSKLHNRPLIPFVVTADNTIPIKENLKMKFEVYNLTKDTSGTATITIDYSVKPNEGFLKRLFSSKENEVSLSLNFETQRDYLSKVLEISTEKFSPGSYELFLTSRELNRNQTVKRTVGFTISEN